MCGRERSCWSKEVLRLWWVGHGNGEGSSGAPRLCSGASMFMALMTHGFHLLRRFWITHMGSMNGHVLYETCGACPAAEAVFLFSLTSPLFTWASRVFTPLQK